MTGFLAIKLQQFTMDAMGPLSALYEQLEAGGEAHPSRESTKSMVKASLSLL